MVPTSSACNSHGLCQLWLRQDLHSNKARSKLTTSQPDQRFQVSCPTTLIIIWKRNRKQAYTKTVESKSFRSDLRQGTQIRSSCQRSQLAPPRPGSAIRESSRFELPQRHAKRHSMEAVALATTVLPGKATFFVTKIMF